MPYTPTNWVDNNTPLSAENLNNLETQYKNAMADGGIPYAVDTGSVNALTATILPVPTSYTDGLAVCIKIANTTTGAATVNLNGLGAVPLKNGDGSSVGAGDLVAGVPVTFRYVGGASPAFIASGSGGISGTGNATAADVLSPKTFTSSTGKLQQGAIPTVSGGNTITPSPNQQTAVTANSYVQGAIVVAGVSFDASKLLTGTTVAGTAGTMPNRGSPVWTPGTSDQALSAGYYPGGTVKGDANLQAGNIKNGVPIFGVTGNLQQRQYASGSGTFGANGVATVSGLSFQPSMIIVEWDTVNYGWARMSYGANARTDLNNAYFDTASQSAHGLAGWTINSNGFVCNTSNQPGTGQGAAFNWYAFG